MPYFLSEPVDVTPGSTGSYVITDLSSHIQAGDTPAIAVFIVNNTSGSNQSLHIRHPDSTDDFYQAAYADQRFPYYSSVKGATNEVAIKIADTLVKVWLIGYFRDDEATGFTNAYDKSTGTTGSYVDVDCSSECPSGKFGVFLMLSNGVSAQAGLRPKGSSDAWYTYQGFHQGHIVPFDSAQTIQQKIGSTSIDLKLIGYITTGTTKLDGVDVSIGTTGAYVDRDCDTLDAGNVPSDAEGVLVYAHAQASGGYSRDTRMNGQTTAIYNNLRRWNWMALGLDANNIFEVKIDNTGIDHYIYGYFQPAASGQATLMGGGLGDDATLMGGGMM